jgi:hypothetical protein
MKNTIRIPMNIHHWYAFFVCLINKKDTNGENTLPIVSSENITPIAIIIMLLTNVVTTFPSLA